MKTMLYVHLTRARAHLDGLARTGLESINDESRRWSMPITGGITVRF